MIFILMTDRAHMPESKIDFLCFEELLEDESTDFKWAELPEDTAAGLCYVGHYWKSKGCALFAPLNRLARFNYIGEPSKNCP
jgi:fatty-acyl-CoA synthase